MIREDFVYLSINNLSSASYYPLNSPANFISKAPDTLEFDNESRWFVGVSSFSHGMIDTSKDIKFICIHLDFISNQMCGNKLKRIVYMAPFINKVDFMHNIFNIKYCRIEKNSLSEIRCYLTDENNDEIRFIDDCMTYIELKFKKSI